MSDDRVWLHRVGAGLIDDPCSYSCWAKDSGCTASTGYQPDKTANGMRLLTDGESRFYRALTGKAVLGSYTCETHAPRMCNHCGDRVPWWDGTFCDYCDRYADETG